MGRNAEAAVIAIFAAVIAVPSLAIFSWLAVGPQPSGNHVHLAVLLSIAGAVAAFVSARLLLARSALYTWRDGLKLGVSSALVFYVFWILLFAGIPALIGAPRDSWIAAISFLLRASWHVMATSRGLPIIIGVAGGLAYVHLKQRMIRRSAAEL